MMSQSPARLSRRRFLEQTRRELAGMMISPAFGTRTAGIDAPRRLRVAAVVTEFTYRSHAHVILENFLEPYLFNGRRTDAQFACKLVGDAKPKATSFYVGPWENRNLFRAWRTPSRSSSGTAGHRCRSNGRS